MGSPSEEPNREAQEVRHRVTLSQDFWLGAFEVTQRQWQRVMGANPSWFADGTDQRPVERVTWHEVQTFLERVNVGREHERFRLPTEAEWEYACRAGTTTAYNIGQTLNARQANVAPSPTEARSGAPMPVGSFPPNAWGLYDMHGNVWEWTSDEHCPYDGADVTDPTAHCTSGLKTIRGGSWYFGSDSARCALRYTHRPQDRGFSLGFRLVREVR